MRYFSILITAALLFNACGSTRPTTTPNRPAPTRPGTKPNTGTNPGNTTSPGNTTTPGGQTQPGSGTKPTTPTAKQETYKVAVLLPFLTNQLDAVSGQIPEKSLAAAQYYGGMQVAFKSLSNKYGYPNLVVDVLDTQASDADFQKQLSNPRLTQAQVVIGPIRNSHITMLAERTKTNKQIVVSPESPTSELTTGNPGFVQTAPSLRAHCARIIQHLRSEKKYTTSQIILVGKEKEADRFEYFQDANRSFGTGTLTEVKVPDASTNFDKTDLKKYMRAGQTTAFVMPSWAGQDWIMAFLSRLKATKGSNRVEVYGMPQWADYEQIEPELLTALNVHISAADYIDHNLPEVQEFERSFYEMFGTLPNDDAFNGYDVVLFTAEMLKKYGLSFPEKMTASPAFYSTLRGGFYMRRVTSTPVGVDTGSPAAYDYIENIYVHILKFDQFGFRPPED